MNKKDNLTHGQINQWAVNMIIEQFEGTGAKSIEAFEELYANLYVASHFDTFTKENSMYRSDVYDFLQVLKNGMKEPELLELIEANGALHWAAVFTDLNRFVYQYLTDNGEYNRMFNNHHLVSKHLDRISNITIELIQKFTY